MSSHHRCCCSGCCAGGGEPCALPSATGAAAPLVITGSSSITLNATAAGPTASSTSSTYSGGTSPTYAVACEQVGTVAVSGDTPACPGIAHTVYSDSTTLFSPTRERDASAAVTYKRSGATSGGCVTTPGRLEIYYTHTLAVTFRFGGGAVDFVVTGTLDLALVVDTTDPNAPCFTQRTGSVQWSIDGAGSGNGSTGPIALDSMQVSIVRDGRCATAVQAFGQITVPGLSSPYSAGGDSMTVEFDLTFEDGIVGCSHEAAPINCVGACCIDGECSQMTAADCQAAGGVFVGQGVPCSETLCGPGGEPPSCCDDNCCRVSDIAPGGNININWSLTMEVQGRTCCTNFNPSQIKECTPTTVMDSGVATVPYTSDCMNFTEGQVQGDKSLPNLNPVNTTCCTPGTISNIFIFPNVVGFIASCNATSGPLFTFIIRLSTPGGAVVSFVAQSCNHIEFDETVSVFRQSCGISGTEVYYWLADIRFIGSATISGRYPCPPPGLSRPAAAQGRGVVIPGLTRDVEFHGPEVTLEELRKTAGCGECGSKKGTEGTREIDADGNLIEQGAEAAGEAGG